MADSSDPGRRNAQRDLKSAGYRGKAHVAMPDGKSVKQNRGAQGAPNTEPPRGVMGRTDPMNPAPTADDAPPTKPFPGGDSEWDV